MEIWSKLGRNVRWSLEHREETFHEIGRDKLLKSVFFPVELAGQNTLNRLGQLSGITFLTRLLKSLPSCLLFIFQICVFHWMHASKHSLLILSFPSYFRNIHYEKLFSWWHMSHMPESHLSRMVFTFNLWLPKGWGFGRRMQITASILHVRWQPASRHDVSLCVLKAQNVNPCIGAETLHGSTQYFLCSLQQWYGSKCPPFVGGH